MSWQSYVDTSLIGTKKVDQAAIFNSAGDSVWASSPGFSIKPEETKHIVAGFQNSEPLYTKGIHIADVKYLTIKADDRSIYGKQGKAGIVCVKTKQAILVAHYPETIQPGEAATVVEKLGDYLISVGY